MVLWITAFLVKSRLWRDLPLRHWAFRHRLITFAKQNLSWNSTPAYNAYVQYILPSVQSPGHGRSPCVLLMCQEENRNLYTNTVETMWEIITQLVCHVKFIDMVRQFTRASKLRCQTTAMPPLLSLLATA